MTNEEALTKWHKLQGVHPVLIRKVAKVLQAMETLGFSMMVTDGIRTVLEQQALYAQGRTMPGHIVTNCDGVIKKSNHQLWADSLGHAVDCTFLDQNGHPSWEEHYPWETYGACCRAVGLVWGIHLNATTIDRPHTELANVA